jgi:hypothetical protein
MRTPALILVAQVHAAVKHERLATEAHHHTALANILASACTCSSRCQHTRKAANSRTRSRHKHGSATAAALTVCHNVKLRCRVLQRYVVEEQQRSAVDALGLTDGSCCFFALTKNQNTHHPKL